MNGRTIAEHPFFQGMSVEHLDILAEGAREVQFETDEVIFQEGGPANQFYLIKRGSIALETHEPGGPALLVQKLGEGEVLGWSWLFSPFVWHFQARALEPTQAIVLNGAHLMITSERDHDFGYELMKRVAQVVIQRLHATHQHLMEEIT